MHIRFYYGSERDVDLPVEPDIKEKSQTACHNLPENGGVGCACNTQLRKAEQSEDHYRIKYYVCNSTRKLCDHRKKCFSGGLEKSFQSHLGKRTYGQKTDDRKVGYAILCYLRIGRLGSDERRDHRKSQNNKKQIRKENEHYAHICRLVRSFKVLFSQSL